MNWEKYENKKTWASCSGAKMQPEYMRNDKGEVVKSDEFNIQDEINSHYEETLIEPQIVAARLQGRTLAKEETGTYVDLSALGQDKLEMIQNSNKSKESKEVERLEAALEIARANEAALKAQQPAAPAKGEKA